MNMICPKCRCALVPMLGNSTNLSEVVDQVTEIVAIVTGIATERIMSHVRHRDVVDARHLCFLLTVEVKPNATCKGIGRLFRMDHSTVIHGIRCAKNMIELSSDHREWHNTAKNILKPES